MEVLAYDLSLWPVLGVLSGLALMVLGAVVLFFPPRRFATVSFAVFAMIWGAAVAVANTGLLAVDPATARPWVYVQVALYIPLYVYVLYFVLRHPTPMGAFGRRADARILLAVPALVLLLLFIVVPRLFVLDVVVGDHGFPSTVQGVLFSPVVETNSVIVFGLAFLIVLWRVFRCRQAIERSQLALLSAGFLFYVSYRAAGAVGLLTADHSDLVGSRGMAGHLFFVAGRVICSLAVLAALGVVLASRDLPWRRLLVAAALVPFAAGVLDHYALELGWWLKVSPTPSVGLWRILAVAIFAYAIVRMRLFDLDLKLKWTLNKGLVAAVILAVFTVVSEGTREVLEVTVAQGQWIGVIAAGVLVLLISPLMRVVERLTDAATPRVRPGTEYMQYRKFEVYKAAVLGMLQDGHVTQKERGVLDRLRDELGILEADAAALEADMLKAA